MSVPLPGFETLRLLRTSARGRVYEAERVRDGKRVVAKVFELGDEDVEARVEHEFRLLQELDVEGIVRALAVERVGDQLVLLLDHVPGRNLAQHIGGQAMAPAKFLPAALSLTATLARVHEHRVVHRDIKPSNILVDQDGALHLADFGISVLLERQRRHRYDPQVLAGTLPYLPPEQSGRARREVDFRSDLYSLGAIFYEMLTGRRPFESTEPLELIHAHLARRPKPPNELVAGVPKVLAAIVMKLLRKAPEHRYQSARGLAADLEKLADALAGGEGEPEFPLGEHDHSTTLQLPHQLYGRRRERLVLEQALATTVETRERKLVLVHGAAGLGKSALLHEIEAPLSARGGYMAIASFDHQHREQPYRAFTTAFASLVDQVLAESDARLRLWRRRLHGALGPVAGVVTELVPQLALVLGELPPVPELTLGEARNRLHLALARFVAAFAAEAPLVLCVDDLQWADPDSLTLLRALLEGGDDVPVLLVATYCDGSPDCEQFLDELRRDQSRRIQELELQPLSEHDVDQMLADMLGREPAEVEELAALVSRKTSNNPLFVRQFLIELDDLSLLRSKRSGWEWDTAAIAAAPIPDTVLGMMRAKIEGLPDRERELLSHAACVGVRFDPSLLTAITERPRDALVADLLALEQRGLIAATGDSYQFSHDRIAEVASELLAPASRRELRGSIGRELLARARARGPDLGEQVFEIVDALNEGQRDMSELDEAARVELAQLGVEAGERALATAAWTSARRYLEHAIVLLAPELEAAKRGQGRRELVLSAHFGRAQAIGLAGDVDAASTCFDELLCWELSLAEHGRVVARRIRILTLQQRVHEAVREGLVALARCGIRLSPEPSMASVGLQIIRASRLVKKTTLADLLHMEEIRDERVNTALELICVLEHSALVVNLNLFVVLTAIHARLVIEHGFHPSAAEGLAQLAISIAGTGRPHEARVLAEDAVALARERPSTASTLARTEAAALLFAGPCFRPFRECATPIEDAARRSLEVGERESAGCYGALGLGLHLIAGTHLRDVLELEPRLRREMPDWGTHEMALIADMNARYAEALVTRGQQPRPFLTDEDFAGLEVSKLTQYVVIVVEFDGRLLIALAEHRLTAKVRRRLTALTDPILTDAHNVLFGAWQLPRFLMLHAILSAERCRHAKGRKRRRLLARLRRHLASLRRWERGCRENFGAMAELAAGELAMTSDDHGRAMACYELAQRLASDNGLRCVEGLARLRITALAERLDWDVIARGSLTQARKTFERWGAWGLADRVERRDLGHIQAIDQDSIDITPGSSMVMSLRASTAAASAALDVATMLSTLQMIGESLRLEDVITKVLAAAIEHAGADRGLLLLERDGEIALVAEGDAGRSRQFMASPVPLRSARERLPTAVVNYVLRTRAPVVVEDLGEDPRFSTDPYARHTGARSLLCMPIIKRSERVGALVLENRLVSGAFTSERLEVLRILLAQAASTLDNARLHAALTQSEARWRSLVDGAPDIIALVDEHGQVEFVNHLGHDTTASPEQVIGLRPDAIMDPASATRWREALAEVQVSRRAREVELCVTAPTREGQATQPRWYMTRLAPIKVAGEVSGEVAGRVGKILTISTDTTERKQFEAQQRQQQRLESIGTLANGVAHEINNPVQGILNYAELLSARPTDADTVREFSAEISTEAKRVATIVRNLLAFSRQEQDRRFELIEVTELIEGTLSLIHAVLRKDHVTLDIDVPSKLSKIRCRAQQIQQVLMNLVTNARDALNERYPGDDPAKRIEVQVTTLEREGAPWVRVSVRDSGAGIPARVLDHIFDPFFTTKGRDKGTGLGLSVSHGIATEHGGELSVDSEPGSGATFHLDLPVAGPSD